MAVLRFSALALTAAALLAPAAALAGDAAAAHSSWKSCLDHAYVSRAAVTGQDLAAAAALRACRGEETAYLSALSASPLLDGDDIAQARPELVARARAALTTGPRSVLR
ncbi:hypothetical protein [Methylobacterium sp. J-076]|uniref:hypothetical protein n=1 Tax=Methylobacterium sp. J-076 TaxID=2836655 RepID=UPI001FBB543A|nr:hypothetical protein [Methylobacterium sp. J-076]MCJ2015280.1 hypothetical protein [Methylobacterium sp. J-076]